MIEKPTPTADHLTLEDFAYDLPPELIAQAPLDRREQSRLLLLSKENGAVKHMLFENIVDLLSAGDLLVVNNTRVIPARLIAQRKTGGKIKILLLKPQAQRPGVWEALVSPIKRLKPGEHLIVDPGDGSPPHSISIFDIVEGPDGFKRLLVDLGGGADTFLLLSRVGNAPLPPYIHRELISDNADTDFQKKIMHREQERQTDLERYQTVYAKEPGAVAAPTAGLHFSESLLGKLKDKGTEICEVTLHVGPGTFKPIETDLDDHFIETETYSIPVETAKQVNAAKQENRRVIAVGTTTLRALETAGADGSLKSSTNSSTDLYVKPGYNFKIVDGLITNFHLSKSSLLVLVSAFAGHGHIMNAYQTAVSERYRFYSYGDAMLIL